MFELDEPMSVRNLRVELTDVYAHNHLGVFGILWNMEVYDSQESPPEFHENCYRKINFQNQNVVN